MNADREVLREALAALQMSPAETHAWLERVRTFCRRHGGEGRYARLLALLGAAIAQTGQEGR
jgi:hypothetical protein